MPCSPCSLISLKWRIGFDGEIRKRRYFRLASQFVDIDQEVIVAALNWLAEHQERSGAFKETGHVVYPRMQESDAAVTAFAALAFMDNQFDFPDSSMLNAMNKAIREAIQ